MGQCYKLYNDNGISLLEKSCVNFNSIDSISRDKCYNLVSFFDEAVVIVSLNDNKININEIQKDDFVIKPCNIMFDSSMLQHFGIKNAYVVTTDKDIVVGICNFYSLLKDKVDNKRVFDASGETKLQEVFNRKFISNGFKQLDDNVVNVNSKNKTNKKGLVSIVLILIVSALLLTIMSVMIGMKILGI